MNLYPKHLFLIAFFFSCLKVFGQTGQPSLQFITSSIDTFNIHFPAEKLYVQTDKPYYTAGDTIWFKAYVVDAAFLTPSLKSGLMYIEIANDTNQVLLRRMVPVKQGFASGNIALLQSDLPEGSYTLSAYTNLMRNFGSQYIFRKAFYISGLDPSQWLLSNSSSITNFGGNDKMKLNLQVTKMDKQPIGLKDLRVRVVAGKKTLMKDKVQTKSDGSLEIEFDLPGKGDGQNIFLEAEDIEKGQNRRITMPITVKRVKNVDVQFFPEGGSLLAGAPVRVAFKAIGEDGMGVDVSGKVYKNAVSDTVATLKSEYAGMGSFYIVPEFGKQYTANIVFADGSQQAYQLPAVLEQGTALSVNNKANSDSIRVTVTLPPGNEQYYLTGQSGNALAWAASIKTSKSFNIAKSLFLTGVGRFTLFNHNHQPLNERMFFTDHHDQLSIQLNPAKKSYNLRDSIALEIVVRDKFGKPVQGDFSIAVTDDGQVKQDSIAGNLLTQLLLTSGLKGNIESPSFYLQHTEQSFRALDNLMLTQGWSRFAELPAAAEKKNPKAGSSITWAKIFEGTAQPEFRAEQEFTVRGRVTNLLNKPIQGTEVIVLSSNPAFVENLATDQNGEFSLTGFPEADTLAMKFQANKNAKARGTLKITEFDPPHFEETMRQVVPWYLNSDTLLMNNINAINARKYENLNLSGIKNLLSEVTITTTKIIPNSKNKNGPGGADIVLDEYDMKKAGRMTLFQLLQKRFPNFSRRFYYGYEMFSLYEKRVTLSIDGVEIRTLGKRVGDYMDFIIAEDITGIEIMNSSKYELKYEPGYIRLLALAWPQWVWVPIHLEITTRSGNGAFLSHSPGTYLYRSIPFAGRQQFYTPRYRVKESELKFKDYRSTIHWQPNVKTDSTGKSTISFFSSDKAGTYTVIAEGMDMSGHVGSATTKINIKP